jgi:hypothetical protein
MMFGTIHHGHIHFHNDSHTIQHHELNYLPSKGSMQASIHSTLHGRCNNMYSCLLKASQIMVLDIQIPFDRQLNLDGHFGIFYKIQSTHIT